jgi:hypothetical protein
MGKAKHPHDADRPEPARIRKALEAQDIEALGKALTYRQRRFCEEYVVDYNGTAAAIRAGYATQWADRQAHILLKHEGVKAYIDHLSRSKEAKIMAVDPDYLLQKLVNVMNKPGAKDSDILRAVELYMKHKGMFIDRQEISGPDGGAIEMEQRQRVEEDSAAVINRLRQMSKKPDLKVVGDD